MANRKEKRFNIRARLFVGSLPNDVDEAWLRELFKPHSDISEVFLHKEKGFGFIRCETRASALKAKTELDYSLQKGKTIRVKFSVVQSYVKITNLPPFVGVELLENAFSRFGEIEMCHVICDEKGNPKGFGYVLFGKRKAAEECINACASGAFLLTRLPMPVNVTMSPTDDDLDDVYEDSMKKTKEYHRDREVPPRFAMPQTFDHELAQRWKALDEIEKKQKEELENEMRAARIKLMDEMMKALQEQEDMLHRAENVRRDEERRKGEELQQLQELRKLEDMRRQDEHRKLEELARQEELKRKQIDWEIAQREKAIRDGREMMMNQGQGGHGPPPMMGGPPPMNMNGPPGPLQPPPNMNMPPGFVPPHGPPGPHGMPPGPYGPTGPHGTPGPHGPPGPHGAPGPPRPFFDGPNGHPNMFPPHQGPPGPPMGMHMGTPPPAMMGPMGPLPMPMGPGGPMMDYPGPPHMKMEPNDHNMRGFPGGNDFGNGSPNGRPGDRRGPPMHMNDDRGDKRRRH